MVPVKNSFKKKMNVCIDQTKREKLHNIWGDYTLVCLFQGYQLFLKASDIKVIECNCFYKNYSISYW